MSGLRIANPDEDNLPSPPISPIEEIPSPYSPSSPQNARPNLLPKLSHQDSTEQDRGDGGIDFSPDSYSLANGGALPQAQRRASSTPQADLPPSQTRLQHRQSSHMSQRAAQQAMQHSGSIRRTSQQPRAPSASYSSSMQPGSGVYSSSQGSYRYREEVGTPGSSGAGLARNGSRSAGAAGAYRSASQRADAYDGAVPPRRNSRRIRAPSNGAAIPAYDATSASYLESVPVSNNAEEWRERGAAVSTRQETDASGQVHIRTTKKGVKDFNFGRTLGEGSYSTVLAATDRQNLKEYAIKVLDKRHIIKEKKVKYVNIERDTLNRLTEHPGVVRLYYTFQDERSLYFVLDLASGGELLGVLKKLGSFDVECARFYAAQILDSVAYMHSRGVIHRDLKPENVLLDRDMHTKITDFGTAKILPDPKPNGTGTETVPGHPTDGADTDRANSFVGTAEYVSPELLQRSNACKASDLWALGCIIYQMIAGKPPFKAANEYLTFQKILSLEYSFPDGFPPDARDLVERLIVLDPAKRLSVEHIKAHPFFDGVQWGKSLWRQKAPRLKPYLPPPAEPIRFGVPNGNDVHLSSGVQSQAPLQPQQQPQHRPNLRGITDLPPPSQLDIDWSPVLTHINERILKLGNLMVTVSQPQNSPSSKPGEASTPSEKPKFRSFFGGNTNRRKERLVLITSSARLVIAAAGGNEKKAKWEVDCLVNGTSWNSYLDPKGLTAFQLSSVSKPVASCRADTLTSEQRDNFFTFEDPRATTSDPNGSKYSTQEWLDALDQAQEMAISQSIMNSAIAESSVTTPSDSLGADAAMPMSGPNVADRRHNLRTTLRRNTDESIGDTNTRQKRFSKRHSKGALAAVF